MSLVQRLIIPHKVHKTIEKAQNRSSQLDRLNVKELHTLRDWRHVIQIFSIEV